MKQANEDLEETITMRKTEIQSTKERLKTEKIANSKMFITLQSMEETVASLQKKLAEDTEITEGEIEHIRDTLSKKKESFETFMQSKGKGKTFQF